MHSSDFPSAACHASLLALEPTVRDPKLTLLFTAVKFIVRVWMDCTQSRHWQACLKSVQNSAARVVLKDNHHLSSGDLLCKLHWLPVQSRIEFKIACITYKVLTTGQPIYLSTLLNHYTPLHTLRSANRYRLQHPRVSTEFAKRLFSYLAPKIWNNIPLDIRLCSTLPTFKRHLKTYLFK